MRKILIFISILFLAIACKNDNKTVNITSDIEDTKQPDFHLEVYDETPVVLKEFVAANVLPYYKDSLWGYVEKDGTPVIDAIFHQCGFFSEGFAWVMRNGKYGIINEKGELVIDYTYDEAGEAKYGLIPVRKEKLWGFIDTDGKQVIPFYFEDYAFQDEKTIHVRQNQQWGIINLKGDVICLPLYDRNFEFINDVALVKRNSKSGLINRNGKVLIECNYSSLEKVNDTLYIAEEYIRYDNSKYGLITTAEKFIIPQIYKKMYNVSGKAIIAQAENSAGVLSLSGDTLIDFQYKELQCGKTNLLQAMNLGDHWGYISLRNDLIIPFQYSKAFPFTGNRAVVEKESKKALINVRGETVIPLSEDIDILDNNLIKVQKSWDKYYFCDTNGNKYLNMEFDRYDYHAPEDWTGAVEDEMLFTKEQNGLVIIGIEGNAGMINLSGELVVPLKYHYLEPMDDYGFIIAAIWDKKGILDKNGKPLTEIVYDDIVWDERAHHYMAIQKIKYKVKEYDRIREVPVGYFGADGTYYGQSVFSGQKTPDTEEYITKIREAYKRIEKETKNTKFIHRTFSYGLKGNYSDSKFIVSDESNNMQYMYYYDYSLNRYGPFFIYTISKNSGRAGENRYYFKHGKIIRWLDEDKQERIISNAMYCPEDPRHLIARRHLADFNNQEYLNNKEHNKWQEEVDAQCDQISSDISAGKYKKGDSETQGMGEYQHHTETYLDKNGDIIYSINSEGDEGGGYTEEYFYRNGNPIRTYSNNNWEKPTEEDEAAGWWGGQYNETIYYKEEGSFRTIKELNGVTFIYE